MHPSCTVPLELDIYWMKVDAIVSVVHSFYVNSFLYQSQEEVVYVVLVNEILLLSIVLIRMPQQYYDIKTFNSD